MTGPYQTIVVNVDDEDAPRYVKTRDLEQAGFTVVEATTGAEALRAVQECNPPVVLLDIKLPDISGYEVCQYIKQKWPEIMVLLTSATFTTSAHRTLGLNTGADSYLVQPAEPLELVAGINALLRIRKAEDDLRTLNATLEQRVQDRVKELAEANVSLKAEIAQRQVVETALAQSQKMEAVGQLTSGLAHDFNNLLTAVVGNLDMIRGRSADPRITRLAENAFQAAQRGSKLTAQLLAFSRSQKLAVGPVNVNTLIEGMGQLLKQSLGTNITIRTELMPGLPAAAADVNQLELAILNLSINARDAMPDGGSLTIATSADPGDGGQIRISIVDTGSGMPPEVASRAFDPFFTTKPPGKGTGLGLSQVYGIMHQLGGEVAIETELGHGTTVRLSLPQTIAAVEKKDLETQRSVSGNSEKLLILDDDLDVRNVMTSALSEIGYVIREASDAKSALELVDSFNPDLFIVDFAMPGLNGAEVGLAVRQRRPGLRILFVSGFSNSAALKEAIGDAPVLRKPFRPDELALAVREALGG